MYVTLYISLPPHPILLDFFLLGVLFHCYTRSRKKESLELCEALQATLFIKLCRMEQNKNDQAGVLTFTFMSVSGVHIIMHL